MDYTAYPHTYALANELKNISFQGQIPMKYIHKAAIALVKEYEHGVADVESLQLESIEQLKNIVLEFMLYISTSICLEKEDLNEETNNR